ncbi:BA75_00569T0 [Komagataella pastoris]|uniref:Signal recognition particle SEC65 subunit n=1 Tax=Komagataella pastoris TaxID=4922 RepID=A0A1B2JAH7_PICPA|nr:BA75_00569T0 [Komagataella pastoris]
MPLLEEISDAEDIDNLEMDLAEFDPTLRTPIAEQRPAPQVVRSQDAESGQAPLVPNQDQISQYIEQFKEGGTINKDQVIRPDEMTEKEMTELKSFQVLYPCYFDKKRSVKEGRRCQKEYGVENPLAKTILDACRYLDIPCILEPEKTHPQDFGNPGRVRVAIKENGKYLDEQYKTKRELIKLVGQFLVEHPTTLQKVQELPGPPELQQGGYIPERVPRVNGLKMNDIVPLHSPFTIKHPSTKSVYEKEPEPAPPAAVPKAPKQKKIMVRR